MDPFDNPFRPGAGTTPPALVGRDALIDAYGVALRRTLGGKPGQGLLLTGLRGVGKTVLLRRFQEIAQLEHAEVVAIEASEDQSFRRALAVRMRALLLELESTSGSRAITRALSVLRSFALTLPDGMSIHLDVAPAPGRADSGLLHEDLPDLLEAIGQAASERGTGVVISIDELQFLKAEEFSGIITAYHRTSQLDLPVLLVGAGLPQLPGVAGTAKSYAERLFQFPEVGPLSDADGSAGEVISIPIRDAGLEIEAAAVTQIVAATAGYPYFLQEWGYSTWNAAGTSPIDSDDVAAAQGDVLERLDSNFFRVRYERLTAAERLYLHAMARLGPGPHRSGDIADELGVQVESVAPRRSGLIRKGMIYGPSHGLTAFTVPLFDDFLRRTAEREA